jgi:hypothetical protein
MCISASQNIEQVNGHDQIAAHNTAVSLSIKCRAKAIIEPQNDELEATLASCYSEYRL